MIIPEVIRIGSCDYLVEFTDRDIVVDRSQCKACIDYDNHLISIDSNIGDIQSQEQSFLHEIVHGIISDRAINLKEDDEELIVDELAKGMHQIIRDNPEMFLDEEDIYFEEEVEEEIDV